MPEEAAAPSDAAQSSIVTSGAQTSEFWLTKAIAIGAAVIDGVAVVLDSLHEAGVLPDKPWAATALAAVATIMAVVKAMGYTRSRTLLKLAEAAPAAAAGVAATVPFARATAEELFHLLHGREAQAQAQAPSSLPVATLPLQPRLPPKP